MLVVWEFLEARFRLSYMRILLRIFTMVASCPFSHDCYREGNLVSAYLSSAICSLFLEIEWPWSRTLLYPRLFINSINIRVHASAFHIPPPFLNHVWCTPLGVGVRCISIYLCASQCHSSTTCSPSRKKTGIYWKACFRSFHSTSISISSGSSHSLLML